MLKKIPLKSLFSLPRYSFGNLVFFTPSQIQNVNTFHDHYFDTKYKKTPKQLLSENKLEEFLKGWEQEEIKEESLDLAVAVLEHWFRAHALPIKRSDRKGPVFSLILSSVVGTTWTVKSPIEITHYDERQDIEFRGKAEYGLCYNDLTIPVFEARNDDAARCLIACSFYGKFITMESKYRYSYGIATSLTEWIFVKFDKEAYQTSINDCISVYSFSLMNRKDFSCDREKTRALLKLIKTFINRAKDNPQ